MTTRKQLADLYNFTVENIESDFNRKRLTQDEAEYAIEAAFNEYQNYLAEFEGVATLDEEILAGNEFGQALIDIADENDWDLQDLSQLLGADPEYLEEIIASDDEPEEDVIDAVVDIFEGYEDVDEDYEEEEGEEEVEAEQDTEEAPYSMGRRNLANFSDYQTKRLEQLENHVVNMEREKQVIAAFNERQRFAAELVNNGDMPPAVYNYVFGSLDGSDNLAQFSIFCEENEVDYVSEFHAIDRVLDIFSKMGLGESGLFMAYSDQVEAAEFSSEESAAEAQARANFLGSQKAKGL
jgi:hypothetical protein